MAVKIRLARFGKKKMPSYRVVVIDERRKREGRILEAVGNYDPKKKENVATVNKERVAYWLQRGAQPTQTVAKLLKRMERSA